MAGPTTGDEIRRAFRKSAKAAHPDAGGSQASMVALMEARDRLLTHTVPVSTRASTAHRAAGPRTPTRHSTAYRAAGSRAYVPHSATGTRPRTPPFGRPQARPPVSEVEEEASLAHYLVPMVLVPLLVLIIFALIAWS